MTKARRKIDGSLKARIALEALGEQATVNDLAQWYHVHPNQIQAWKKQLQDQAACAFDVPVGRDADTAYEREIERLHAKKPPQPVPMCGSISLSLCACLSLPPEA